MRLVHACAVGCSCNVAHALQFESRIELLGAIPHTDIPAVLRRGHVFLNSSRTEAFCMAVLEAVR